jgi:hypothetical protein
MGPSVAIRAVSDVFIDKMYRPFGYWIFVEGRLGNTSEKENDNWNQQKSAPWAFVFVKIVVRSKEIWKYVKKLNLRARSMLPESSFVRTQL